LDRAESSWFVSFLDRLQDISNEEKEKFFKTLERKEEYRFHEINWQSKNIPIAKSDLNWLPKDYINNNEEYPFYQFHISKSLGRFVGFFDENDVFNIVLLDPLHNIQPSKDYEYKVDDCNKLNSSYELLLNKIKNIEFLISENCNDCKEKCPLLPQLNAILASNDSHLVIFLHEDFYYSVHEIINNGQCSSIGELFEYGVEFFKEKK